MSSIFCVEGNPAWHLIISANIMDTINESLTQNLEPTDLVRISQHAEHGRVVVAAKSIKTGTKVIRECPVLVWKEDDWMDYLRRFQALPDHLKGVVLDMYCFPLDSPQLQQFKREIIRCSSDLNMDTSLAMTLLSISLANSHKYYGRTNDDYQEVASFLPLSASTSCALFLYASKVSHSCYPNTTYTSNTKDGKMEYKAVREISEGEMVTFPYIGNLWETPTHMRRKVLQDSKSFLCKCERCMSPDWLRLIKCPCNSKGFLECTYDDQQGLPLWTCASCITVAPRSKCEDLEASIGRLVGQNEMKMMLGGIHSLSLRDLKSDMRRIEQELSPLHFFCLKARSQYVKLCASKAYDVASNINAVPPPFRGQLLQKFGDPSKLRSEAAKYAIMIVKSIECIAAGCCGCSENSFNHEAVYEAATTMFHCSQDLMECQTNLWPLNAKFMVQRYLPLMKLQFGEEDLDVKKIDENIIGISEVSQRLEMSLNVSEDKSPIPKKKGKKKGGSTKKKKARGKK